MLIVDRKLFWKEYREAFDGEELAQPTVDGLNYFLDRFEQETRLKNIPEYAYVLATAYHESGKAQLIDGKKVMVRFQPVKETRERSDSPRRANQDKYWKTGFYGRGFPQTTHEANYRKSGQALGLGDLFVENPDLLLDPQYAYGAMIICMVKGLYTGKKLSDYISDTGKDYKNARKIINGLDKAGLIAGYANRFEDILRAAKVSAAHQQPTVIPDKEGSTSVASEQPPTTDPQPEVKTTEVQQTGGATTAVETTVPAGDPPDAPPTQVSTGRNLTHVLGWFGGPAAIATAVWGFVMNNGSAIATGMVCLTIIILSIIFRKAILDAVRMTAASDPNRKNVT